MTRVLYLQTKKLNEWSSHSYAGANIAIGENLAFVLARLKRRANEFDREHGRRRPWRIIELVADFPHEPKTVVHWQNDAAAMLADAEAKLERKRVEWKPKALDAWELKLCRDAAYFTLCTKDGRMVAVTRAASYQEALQLREASGKPDSLIYAVGSRGRTALVTLRLGEQLLQPENKENTHGPARLC